MTGNPADRLKALSEDLERRGWRVVDANALAEIQRPGGFLEIERMPGPLLEFARRLRAKMVAALS